FYSSYKNDKIWFYGYLDVYHEKSLRDSSDLLIDELEVFQIQICVLYEKSGVAILKQ
ncbi:10814_t:CDS:2, partial [Gigaspora margarita]